MPKEFKPASKKRNKPRPLNPATGKPYVQYRRRRQWDLSPDYRPMALDETYDDKPRDSAG
jgi:hypothetical protein